MYIDKRTLNPFFKKTNSTPQDLLNWVEFLMKECLDNESPCRDGYKYLDKWSIYNFKDKWSNKNDVTLRLKRKGLGGLSLWVNYVNGNKTKLPKIIKEFKEKYGLL